VSRAFDEKMNRNIDLLTSLNVTFPTADGRTLGDSFFMIQIGIEVLPAPYIYTRFFVQALSGVFENNSRSHPSHANRHIANLNSRSKRTLDEKATLRVFPPRISRTRSFILQKAKQRRHAVSSIFIFIVRL